MTILEENLVFLTKPSLCPEETPETSGLGSFFKLFALGILILVYLLHVTSAVLLIMCRIKKSPTPTTSSCVCSHLVFGPPNNRADASSEATASSVFFLLRYQASWCVTATTRCLKARSVFQTSSQRRESKAGGRHHFSPLWVFRGASRLPSVANPPCPPSLPPKST